MGDQAMTNLIFNETKIKQELGSLSAPEKIALVACVLERMRGCWLTYAVSFENGDSDIFDCCMNLIWRSMEGDTNKDDVLRKIAKVSFLLTKVAEDKNESDYRSLYAEGALLAVLYGLKYLIENSDDMALYAMRSAYDTLDQAVTVKLCKNANNVISSEEYIRVSNDDPWVKREIERQQRDVKQLMEEASSESRELLKKRSSQEETMSRDELATVSGK
jgi:uncharacterized protein YjaG (DUF416 family)